MVTASNIHIDINGRIVGAGYPAYIEVVPLRMHDHDAVDAIGAVEKVMGVISK